MSLREQRQAELEALLKTFMTKGHEVRQAENVQALQRLVVSSWQECKTGEEFLIRKGEIMMLDRICAYPDAVKNEYDNFDKVRFEDEPDSAPNPLED